MRIRRIALVLVLGSALAACGSGPELDTRTYTLRHLGAADAEQIVRPYVFGDRKEAPGQISAMSSAITVRETPDNLAKIQRVLEQYDVPKPNVKLRFQLIEADGAGRPDPAIADVEAALRKIFRFAGYKLVAEAFIMGTEFSEATQPIGVEPNAYLVHVSIDRISLAGDSSTISLNVSLRADEGGSLGSKVNARVGQTVVLGSAQFATGRRTLILTVKPELAPSGS